MKKLLISMLTLLVGLEAQAADGRAANRMFIPPSSPRGVTSVSGKNVVLNKGKTVTSVIPSNSPAPVTNEPTAKAKTAGATAVDEKYIEEIKARYAVSYGNVKTYCVGINNRLDKIKLMAGITTGTSIAGTLGGGVATISGFSRKELKEPEFPVLSSSPLTVEDAKTLLKAVENHLNYYNDYNSNMALGVTRSIGSFAAGGANIAGAATSFIGLGEFDNLIADMDFCNSAIDEIQREKTELLTATSEAPEPDPLLAKMNDVILKCDGLESKNILDIKGKMIATGAIVSVSAATGIAGGITSIISDANNNSPTQKMSVANKDDTTKDTKTPDSKEKTTGEDAKPKNSNDAMNVVSNILAVTTTAGSIAGAITSGMTLADLEKNSVIAKACEDFLK